MKIYYETKREAMYRNIKYWGKKPHNIWNEIINENTNVGDIVYDPFSGSNITFFESMVLNRIPITMDLNPLSALITDVYSKEYDEKIIVNIFKNIKEKIEEDYYYKLYYYNHCEQCGKNNVVSNYIWENNIRKELRFKCTNCTNDNQLVIRDEKSFMIPVPKWLPYYDMRNLSLIKPAILKKFGGYNISDLYTDNNLYINILIFDEIVKLKEPYKKLFTLVFVQMVHLTTKMCAVRSKKAGRLYSSSWGRPAFLALTKFMEQNPLIQLERSIFGNNGILAALKSSSSRVGKYNYDTYLNNNVEINNVESPTYIIGNSVNRIPLENKIDFIITDPPYGDIIQYGELSLVWNTWLRLMYPEYKVKLDQEIIVNDTKNYDFYLENLSKVFENCYMYLKPNKKMVFTFNSNKENDWNVLIKLLSDTNFFIDTLYIQQNRRASEANVSAKNGIAITDFYIVLSKKDKLNNTTIKDNNIIKIKEIEKMWRKNNNGAI